MKIQIWDEKVIPILKDRKVCPLTRNDLESFAKKAGFKNVEFYSDFQKKPLTSESMDLVCVLS